MPSEFNQNSNPDKPNFCDDNEPDLPMQAVNNYELTYRDGNFPMPYKGVVQASGLMDGLFGCFKPFYNNFIGKNKPPELENDGKMSPLLVEHTVVLYFWLF